MEVKQPSAPAPLSLPRPVSGVLFDLDDTLYDRRAAFRSWSEKFLREQLRIVDDGECASTMAWIESLDANGYGSKHAVIVELCSRFPEASGLVDRFYDEFVGKVTLDDDALRVLAHLQSIGMPFGVITNGTARQWRKIEAMNLKNWTEAILVSETFGAKKPHPSIFLAGAEALGSAPESVLFVGDNPEADIAGAHGAGMMTAWLNRGRTWPSNVAPTLPEPDLIIAGLDELIPLIR